MRELASKRRCMILIASKHNYGHCACVARVENIQRNNPESDNPLCTQCLLSQTDHGTIVIHVQTRPANYIIVLFSPHSLQLSYSIHHLLVAPSLRMAYLVRYYSWPAGKYPPHHRT